MALAVRAAHLGQQKVLQLMLVLTMIFGAAFLVIKGFEYHEHWVDMQSSTVPRPLGLGWSAGSAAVRSPGPNPVLLLFLHDRLPRHAHGGWPGHYDHDSR